MAPLSLAVALAATATSARAQPAFPGAEGFGATATGGRGGAMIKVTSLAESGPGTVREALATQGPRTIVFAVSGIIDLGLPNPNDPFDESDGNDILVIPYGDVTIAGQTAPGAGVTIRGRLYADYNPEVGNIIVRHVRIRPAPFPGGDGEQHDTLRFALNQLAIFDHVSAAFGVDEGGPRSAGCGRALGAHARRATASIVCMRLRTEAVGRAEEVAAERAGCVVGRAFGSRRQPRATLSG